MRTFIINENDDGLRVDRFIKKITTDLPNSVMYKMIRKKDVLLNKKRTTNETILKEGDRLEIYIHDKYLNSETDLSFRKSSGELDIVYEDENILVVDKPVGLLSHSSQEGYEDNLVFRIWKYLYLKGEYNPLDENTFSPALCGRLDRNTGGLLLAGKNSTSLRYFNKLMKEGMIKRKYLAIIEGVPKQATGSIKSPLLKDEETRTAVVEEGSIATTLYTVISVDDFLTLVEAELITGRFHQIRAHFSAIGHPLLGDKKYGAKRETKLNHQALYAYKIIIKTDFEYEKPEGFNKYNDITFQVETLPDIYDFS